MKLTIGNLMRVYFILTNMANIVFISPHLDDAVLSCNLRIMRHVAAGDTVSIISVFTNCQGSVERKAEDAEACQLLGATLVHLDFPDAPIRNNRYKIIRNIVFSEPDEIDLACLQEIRTVLDKLIPALNPTTIYFPLAAGTHIDHRLVWQVAQSLMTEAEIYYYEDRPYSLWPGILAARLQHLGVQHNMPAISSDEMRSSIDDYFFLKYFVPTGSERDECLPLYLGALEEAEVSRSYRFESSILVLAASESEMQLGWQAVCLYKSQIKYIYRNINDYLNANLTTKAESNTSQYLERFWQISEYSPE